MRIVGVLLTAVAFVVLAGCATTQPVQNVQNAPVVLPSGKSATSAQVGQAIMRAGLTLGWQMEPAGPGKYTGRLALRQHTAIIDVEHDAKSYSIKYRDSTNLDARDGMIHKNYNGWIQNLDKAIRAQLATL
jgi:hypothetical protein